jgi:hypothetical protein
MGYNIMTNETQIQPRRSLLRRMARLIPFFGFYDYVSSGDYTNENKTSQNKANIKAGLHISNVAISPLLAIGYFAISTALREYNPLKWREANREQQEHQRVYSDLSNQLFGENGLADVDKDGVVSFNERIDTLTRAGCINHDVENISIRQATTSDLQRAVDSYKGEK